MSDTNFTAYDNWTAAELAWMAEIKRAFPTRRAGDVRYTRAAEGETGTPLHAAYNAWQEAGDAWKAEREKGLVLIDL